VPLEVDVSETGVVEGAHGAQFGFGDWTDRSCERLYAPKISVKSMRSSEDRSTVMPSIVK